MRLFSVPAAAALLLSLSVGTAWAGTGVLTAANLESTALTYAQTAGEYALMAQLPADHVTARPNDWLIARIEWDNPRQDYDLAVYDEAGTLLARSDGLLPTLEEVHIPAGAGTRNLTVRAEGIAGHGEGYRGMVFLQPGAINSARVAGPDAPVGDYAAPRFHLYPAPQGRAIRAGEPTLFKNPKSENTMYVAVLETFRVAFDDATSPARASWTLRSPANGVIQSLDPIVVGDEITGRVFNSQLTGANSLFAFSDDDGESWTFGQIGPPNGGADHQSIVPGPYGPDTAPGLPTPLYPNAVYYCSQSVAAAFCARSDDGGLTFGPGIPIYPITDCYGLHGHVKTAPDGTVVIPNKSCLDSPGPTLLVDGKPAVVVSTDSGVTWDVRTVPTGTSSGSVDDPSVAIARDSKTVYLAYMENGGRLKVAVSPDLGLNWAVDQDILTQAGVEHVAFPTVVAGDADRALVFFLGTPQLGNYANATFDGIWYPYTSYTQDGGKTWVTQKLADNIVQRNGVCGGGACRNLLDFNDLVIDEKGFAQIGYADGCLGSCEVSGPNSFQSAGIIARQSGGPSLYAEHDPVEPMVPKTPRVEGYRTGNFAHLSWPATDNGGADISGYKIYRSEDEGDGEMLATVSGTAYTDLEARADVAEYRYRVSAVNGEGEGAKSAPLALKIGDNVPADARACTVPGFTALTDPTNEDEADAPIETPETDIVEVLAFEPEGSSDLGLSLRMRAFTTAGLLTQYTVRFGVEGGEHEFGNLYFVRLDNGSTSGGPVRSTFGYMDAVGALIEVGVLPQAAEVLPGEIRLRVPKEIIGNPMPGTRISQIFANVSLISNVAGQSTGLPGAASPYLRDRAGFGHYTLVGNDFCAKGAVLQPPGEVAPAKVIGPRSRFGGALNLLFLWPMLGGLAYRRRWRKGNRG